MRGACSRLLPPGRTAAAAATPARKRGRRGWPEPHLIHPPRQALRDARSCPTVSAETCVFPNVWGSRCEPRTWTLLCCLRLVAVAGEALRSHRPQSGRDCQTVRACQYGRGGVYRGCLGLQLPVCLVVTLPSTARARCASGSSADGDDPG
jgi:hypothetical protein